MTVLELIIKLQEIEDKKLPVYILAEEGREEAHFVGVKKDRFYGEIVEISW